MNIDLNAPSKNHSERRRHVRVPLGLPVRVHFAGRTAPLTVELADVSEGGCYFRGAAAPATAKLAFGFVLPDRQVCVAAGKVLRVDDRGFAATIDRANGTFTHFFLELSGPLSLTVTAA
ncbi:MAG: PilZ domain-containing protein [Pseudomonadota bacterium]